MPLTVEEYHIGQLFMIAKHSHEQSEAGEGVEVIANRSYEDAAHGMGQFTEKRIHLSSRLPSWIQAVIPRVIYVTEKSWNYYPFTITEYTCSFLPRLKILIRTRYEDNSGTSENCLELAEEELKQRVVDVVDIAIDEVTPKNYKEEEDLRMFVSKKTGRGPLKEGWRDMNSPVMCSYKAVIVSFEVWGFQSRVEDFVHRAIREILLLGHRQAFAWVDEWYGMSVEDVRTYENEMQAMTNSKVLQNHEDQVPDEPAVASTSSPKSKSWFSWS